MFSNLIKRIDLQERQGKKCRLWQYKVFNNRALWLMLRLALELKSAIKAFLHWHIMNGYCVPWKYVCALQLHVYCSASQFWNQITAKTRIIDKRNGFRQRTLLLEIPGCSNQVNLQLFPQHSIELTLLHYSLRDTIILLTLELIKWTIICPEPAQKSFPLCQPFNAMNASPQRFCTKYVDRLNINNCSIRVTVLDRDKYLVDKFWRTLIFIPCIWIMLTLCFFSLHRIASTTALKTFLYMTTWETQIISLTSMFYTCYMCV